MAGSLFRQDPALRTLVMSIPGSVLIGMLSRSLLVDVVDQGAVSGAAASFVRIVAWLNVWVLLTLVIVKSNISSRCSRLCLSLPVEVRSAWLVRMGAIGLAIVVPAAVHTLVTGIRGLPDGGLSLDSFYLGYGLRLVVAGLLAVFLLQAPSRRVYKAGEGPRYGLYVVLVSAGLFALFYFAPFGRVLWFAAVLGVAALGSWIYVTLPQSFELVDGQPQAPNETVSRGTGRERPVVEGLSHAVARPGPGEAVLSSHPVARREPARRSVGTRLLPTRAAIKLAHSSWHSWVLLVVVAMCGLVAAETYDNGGNVTFYTAFGCVWIWMIMNAATRPLALLDPLPIPRKYLFAVAVLPGLFAFALGLGGWQIYKMASPSNHAQVTYHRNQIQVPPEFWEIKREGEIPVVESPWGESHRPQPHRICPLGGWVAYNPYERGDENSIEFAAYQIDRAIEAAHGLPLPRGTYDSGIELEVSFVRAVEEGSFAVERSVGAGSQGRRRALAVGALAGLIFGTVFLLLTMRAYSPSPYRGAYMGTAIVVVGLFILTVVAVFIADVNGFISGKTIDVVPGVYLRRAAARIPIGEPVLWMLAVGLFAASYLLIQSRFEHAELTGKSASRTVDEY